MPPSRDTGSEARAVEVLCLRPEQDFLRVGVTPPRSLSIAYRDATDADTAVLLQDASALVLASYGPPLDNRMVASSRRLRLVQFTGAGTDRIDGDAAARRGIAVENVAGTNATTVAQYVVSTAIALLRALPAADSEIRAGRYLPFRSELLKASALRDLSGLVIGIVGFGSIGRAVANAFRSLEPSCTILYYDPAIDGGIETDVTDAQRRTSLADLLRQSDVVTLHVPLLATTRGMVGRRELSLMKRDAVLVQASRGGVVDEAALAGALKGGRLAGAAVDVYEHEPPQRESPLLSLHDSIAQRVVLTPHIGGVCRQSEKRQFTAAWQNVERVLSASPHSAGRSGSEISSGGTLDP